MTTTRKGGLRCGHNPKKGVLGTCTVKKSGFLWTCLAQREGIRNWSCTKVGSWELIYHLSSRLLVHMIFRLKQRGRRNGHNQKMGVLAVKVRAQLANGGIMCGSGITGVSIVAHTCTCTVHICESPHIMWEVGYRKIWDMDFALGLESNYLCFETPNDIVSKYYTVLSRKLLYVMNCIMNYLWILIIRVWNNEDRAKFLSFINNFQNTEILVWFLQKQEASWSDGYTVDHWFVCSTWLSLLQTYL